EQIECLEAELAETGFAQHAKAEALDQGDIQVSEARALQNIPTQRAQRVRSWIAETGRVKVLRDLRAFAAVGRQHRVSGIDQVHARTGDACQRITGCADGEESAGLE